MIDQRTRRVIEHLIEKNYISKKSLLNKLALTNNQLNYAIEKLNDLFIENHKPIIQIKDDFIFLSSQSLQFSIDFLQNDKAFKHYELNAKERQRYILLMLYYDVNEFLSVNHFLEAISVSKSTFMNDLRKLDNSLNPKQIKIVYSRKKGYYLTGPESELRYYVLKQILQDLNSQEFAFFYQYFLANEGLSYHYNLRLKIHKYLKKYAIQLAENRLNELYYLILFNLPRMAVGGLFQYDRSDFDLIKDLKEYKLAGELLKELNIKDHYAQMFVAALFLSSGNGVPRSDLADYPLIHFLTKQCLKRFELIMGIDIDHKEFFEEQLYSHMRPAFYRILFDLPIVNVLHEKIVQEYYNVYQISREVMQFVQPILGKEIPEQEISFITLYFATILQDHASKSDNFLNAVIVCQSGIGSSIILQKELSHLFPTIHFIGPYSVDDLFTLKEDYQLIFTTVSNIKFAQLRKPVYKVNPIMTDDEKVQLVRDVNGNEGLQAKDVQSLMTIIRNHTSITDEDSLEKELTKFIIRQPAIKTSLKPQLPKLVGLLDLVKPDHILIQTEQPTWEEAIRQVGRPLYEAGSIKSSYIKAIIQDLKIHGPFMIISEKIALLHAKPEKGVQQLDLSLSIFKNDLNFMGKPVSLLLMLAAVDSYQHIKVIENIVEICEDKPLLYDLQACQTSREVRLILKKFLSKKSDK